MFFFSSQIFDLFKILPASEIHVKFDLYVTLFIYLGFYIAFSTVQVISRRVVGRAEETST